jgi:protein TonB
VSPEPVPPELVLPELVPPEPETLKPVLAEPPLPEPVLREPVPPTPSPRTPAPPDALITDAPQPTESVKKPVVVHRRIARAAHPKSAVPATRSDNPVAQVPAVTPPTASASTTGNPPQSWQMRLLAHLIRYKRYPADAQMHRRQGTAIVALRLLPDGSVASARLQSGSGTDALDQEAVALIGRAQPLPVPEGNTRPIDIAVPIQFFMR